MGGLKFLKSFYEKFKVARGRLVNLLKGSYQSLRLVKFSKVDRNIKILEVSYLDRNKKVVHIRHSSRNYLVLLSAQDLLLDKWDE